MHMCITIVQPHNCKLLLDAQGIHLRINNLLHFALFFKPGHGVPYIMRAAIMLHHQALARQRQQHVNCARILIERLDLHTKWLLYQHVQAPLTH